MVLWGALSFFLELGLTGQMESDHARAAVEAFQPVFRQAGWEMELTVKGTVLFVVAILTITPCEYDPKLLQAEQGRLGYTHIVQEVRTSTNYS